jgi:hypothetical protein
MAFLILAGHAQALQINLGSQIHSFSYFWLAITHGSTSLIFDKELQTYMI